MTPIEDFKKILKEHGCDVPSDFLEVFRDLIDAQADLILDQYLEEKFSGESHNNVV
jgi:hypothetical protein